MYDSPVKLRQMLHAKSPHNKQDLEYQRIQMLAYVTQY